MLSKLSTLAMAGAASLTAFGASAQAQQDQSQPGMAQPGMAQPGMAQQGPTQTCAFNQGPRAGTTVDFSKTLGAQPVMIGAACMDAGSKGFAVAPGR